MQGLRGDTSVGGQLSQVWGLRAGLEEPCRDPQRKVQLQRLPALFNLHKAPSPTLSVPSAQVR